MTDAILPIDDPLQHAFSSNCKGDRNRCWYCGQLREEHLTERDPRDISTIRSIVNE